MASRLRMVRLPQALVAIAGALDVGLAVAVWWPLSAGAWLTVALLLGSWVLAIRRPTGIVALFWIVRCVVVLALVPWELWNVTVLGTLTVAAQLALLVVARWIDRADIRAFRQAQSN